MNAEPQADQQAATPEAPNAPPPAEPKGDWWPRLRQAALPQGAAHWGWWAGGLGAGLLVALIATALLGQGRQAAPAPGSRAEIEAIVKETILANPELIPEAINRLHPDCLIVVVTITLFISLAVYGASGNFNLSG